MTAIEQNPADDRAAGDDDAPALVQAAERAADELDRLVPPADDVANQVLPDNARLVRWAAPLFVACAVILLPWIVIAGITLPARSLSRNYDVAWAGYDVILLIGLISTAVTTLRRSRRLPMPRVAVPRPLRWSRLRAHLLAVPTASTSTTLRWSTPTRSTTSATPQPIARRCSPWPPASETPG